MKAPILLAFLGLATAEAAEPSGTLTLACEGDSKYQSEVTKPTPRAVSFGVIVDFANGTVQGLPSHAEAQVKVNRIDETGIYLRGKDTDDRSCDRRPDSDGQTWRLNDVLFAEMQANAADVLGRFGRPN
jgi:hypothetical protein